MRRTLSILTTSMIMGLLLTSVRADRAVAQLRPLDPQDWSLFETEDRVRFSMGAALFEGQRAALAGIEGRLWEIGVFDAAWRKGAVALEASGTLHRVLQQRHSFTPACCGTRSETETGGTRRDVGDFRIATAVQLLHRSPWRAALRFGVRLPTTDNRVGLERDRTDFFALLGARTRYASTRLSVEAGLGIHGTREPQFEQSDVLLYSVGVRRPIGPVVPFLALVGQVDGLPGRSIRGNEDLQEIRAGVRAGLHRWVEAELVHGLRAFSPDTGLRLGFGGRW